MFKLFIALFSILITIGGFGQALKAPDSIYLKIDTSYSFKVNSKDFRTPSISILQTDLTIDRSASVDGLYQSLNPLKVYKHSSTIFDVVRILLLPEGKFLCYSHNCLSEGISAGNYAINKNIITLKSSKKVYNSLKKDKFIKSMDYGFVTINSISYMIQNDKLIFLSR